ncbi:MAG: acylphosphatase [Chitinivibrionia bacterium]|nr:acylphosphatase [Chitinivibrionia bacterium]
MATLHVWIEGRVQGVFFRDSTWRKALELGLTGWVRNLPDGRVEAVFQGDEEACRKALLYVHNGPPGARVSDVQHRWESDASIFTRFEVTY